MLGPFTFSAFGWWPLALLHQLPAYLVAASCLPLLLLPRVRVAAALACLCAFLAWGRWQLPSAADGSGVTVLSWNIQYQASSAAALRELTFDVALLQEAGLDTQMRDVGAALLAQLPREWHSARGGYEGELMILSKTPIQDVQRFVLDGVREELEGRTAGLRFASVHLVRETPSMRWGAKGPAYVAESARMRNRQVEALLARMDGPATVIGGDFNTPANCAPAARMRQRFQDAFEARGGGLGLTFPRSFPLWRLDYVYVSPELRVLSCETLSPGSSDHRAVLTRIAR